MSMKQYAVLLTVALAIVAAGLLILSDTLHTATFIVQLTDPPIVPTGTQALLVAYSGVALHTAGASNSTGFVSVPASGVLNLMSLTNITQTIAILHTKINASFDSVRLNLTNASITISNETYNVTLLQKTLRVRLLNRTNSSTGGAVVDLTPTIIQIYTGNQTLFAMAPSVRAVAIGKGLVNGTSARIGASQKIRNETLALIEMIRPNITVTGAYLNVAGNTTQFNVTVRNNVGKPVELNHLVLSGAFEALLNSSALDTINTSAVASGINAEDVASVAHAIGVQSITANTLKEIRAEMGGGASGGASPAVTSTVPKIAPAISIVSAVVSAYNNHTSTYANSRLSATVNAIETELLNATASGAQQTIVGSTSSIIGSNILSNSGGMSIASQDAQHLLGTVSAISTLLENRSTNLTASNAQQILGAIENIGTISAAMATNATQVEKISVFDTILNMTANPDVSDSQLAEVTGRLANITAQVHLTNTTQALAIASNLNLTPSEASTTARLLVLHNELAATSIFSREYHGALNFIIAENGTLSLPFMVRAEGQKGYALAVNSSVTFVFNGTMAFGTQASAALSTEHRPMHLGTTVRPIPNATYVVRVTGTDGALARMNVTAS